MQTGFSNFIVLAVLAVAFGALAVNLVNNASANFIYQTSQIVDNSTLRERIGTIVINEVDSKLGSKVTFMVEPPRYTKSLRIQLACYQGDKMVYGETGPLGHAFVLGGASSKWLTSGNSADCAAVLYEKLQDTKAKFVFFASTSFSAGGK